MECLGHVFATLNIPNITFSQFGAGFLHGKRQTISREGSVWPVAIAFLQHDRNGNPWNEEFLPAQACHYGPNYLHEAGFLRIHVKISFKHELLKR